MLHPMVNQSFVNISPKIMVVTFENRSFGLPKKFGKSGDMSAKDPVQRPLKTEYPGISDENKFYLQLIFSVCHFISFYFVYQWTVGLARKHF